MTIAESIKQAITNNLKHTIFFERGGEYVTELCNKQIKGSDTMVFLPPMPKVETETIDDTHDKWKIVYEDATIEGIATWRPSKVKTNQFVFCGIE